jgi:YhcH/YjgK/YiaL family protein
MVIDTLENLSKYVSLNPLFEQVVNFINSHDLSNMENGIHKIDGDDLFVNITTAKGKDPYDAILETHIQMIDIQVPLNTPETYGYTPLNNLPEAEYNSEKDITKYEGPAESFVTCSPGMFAIFFPQDGHAPCISTEPEIHKAIFKVRVK